MDAMQGVKISKIIQCFSFIFLLYYIFFWDTKFVNSRFIFIGLFAISALNILVYKIFFSTPLKGFLCVLYCTFLGIIGTGEAYAFRLSYQMLMCFVIFASFSLNELSFKRMLSVFSILCAIYTGGILLQTVNPMMVQSINRAVLDNAAFASFQDLSTYSYYAGFVGFNCMSALFACVLSGIYLSKLLLTKSSFIKRLLYISIVLIGFIATIVAQKRGVFVANSIAIVIMIIFSSMKRKNAVSFILAIVLLIILYFSITSYLQNSLEGAQFLERFSESDDISSGRFDVYSLLLSKVGNSFIFGKGTGASRMLINMGAHNIYIQIYVDHGIVGLFIYIFWFISNLIFTTKLYKNPVNANMEKRMLFISLYVQIAFLVYGVFGNPITDIYIFLLYVFFVAMSCTVQWRKGSNMREKEEEDEKTQGGNRYIPQSN